MKTSKNFLLLTGFYLLVLIIVCFPLGKGFGLFYTVCTVLIQAGTLCATAVLGRQLFDKQSPAVPFCVMLYLTCPYRLYLLFDKKSLREALCYLVLPLFVWSIVNIMDHKKDMVKRRMPFMAMTALLLILTSMISPLYLLVFAGFGMLSCIVLRKLWPLVCVVTGAVLSLPFLKDLLLYLFTNTYDACGISLDSIMKKGYFPGQFFTSFAYESGHPGLGLGLLMSLAVLGWLLFTEKEFVLPGYSKFFGLLSVFTLILSLRAFPWDYVQRLGTVFLKLVPLTESPALFLGLATFSLSILGGYAMEQISLQKNRALATRIPWVTTALCLFATICLELHIQ